MRSEKTNAKDQFRFPQSNPEAVYQELFRQFHTPLTLFTLRIVKDQAAAEDIALEAFFSLWQKRDSFSEIHSLKSYLYSIARNGSLNWIRKTRREENCNKSAASLEDDFTESVLEAIIYSETMGKIYHAIDELPAQCRKVLVHHFIEGKKLHEIAEEMNLSINTIKTHRAKGISLLQKALNNLMSFILSQMAIMWFFR